MEIVAAVILYVAFATTSNHSSFDEVDEESYSNFSSYPTAAAAPGEFSAGDVSVDHASASTEVFGFESDAVPNSLIRVRSGRYMLTTGMTSNHASFDEVDDESYSNFSSYPTASAAPGEFSAQGDVSVDHASVSTEVFGFGSDAVPNYSHQSPFRSVHADNGNGSNEYNRADDGFFVSDGPIHPPPTEMEPEEGFALREWRRLDIFSNAFSREEGAKCLSGWLSHWRAEIDKNNHIFNYLALAPRIPPLTSNHSSFDEVDEESYSNFSSYPTVAAAPGEFSAGDVSVDHASASTEVFGFESDVVPNSLIRVRSGRYMLTTGMTSNHASFDEVDDESYSNFSSYPTASAAPGEFSAGDVSVDHASVSTEVFGFGSDAVPNYSHQSPFRSVHADNGNGSNEYNGADDGFFVSDGPIHPPPTEMEPEEGFALREWRRLDIFSLVNLFVLFPFRSAG
ncbi:hypothetical protein OIU78_026675 [Salix suchowensis]|nr:hypothetical protein OIU78_026675 [Salix suchowensis]